LGHCDKDYNCRQIDARHRGSEDRRIYHRSQ